MLNLLNIILTINIKNFKHITINKKLLKKREKFLPDFL